MKDKLNIALVAHDSRKTELVEWVTYNINELRKHRLYATGTTGKLIRQAYLDWCEENENEYDIRPTKENWDRYKLEAENLVTCLHSGPLGGDQEIGARIANGEIDILIFFCDNLIQQGHQNDVSALTRLASLYNIAFATNRTTADMILTSPLIKDPNYKRILPSAIEKYKNRSLN
jgi:methylglyoxal synthase